MIYASFCVSVGGMGPTARMNRGFDYDNGPYDRRSRFDDAWNDLSIMTMANTRGPLGMREMDRMGDFVDNGIDYYDNGPMEIVTVANSGRGDQRVIIDNGYGDIHSNGRGDYLGGENVIVVDGGNQAGNTVGGNTVVGGSTGGPILVDNGRGQDTVLVDNGNGNGNGNGVNYVDELSQGLGANTYIVDNTLPNTSKYIHSRQ